MQEVSYIYIISDGTNYKVGVSVNPEKRLKQLQTGSPLQLQIVEKFALPKSMVYRLEKECHQKVSSHYQKRGEWFAGATEFHIRLLVDEICDRYAI